MNDSVVFEQQIHRIYELLEGSGAEVTWDDHIPDPDNPSQPRQIDITIRRGGKVTHVECRQHRDPQDVQWIEDLIGRRVSLRADSIIAVSSSGFTAGALKKAKAHGIIPRDFRELTDREVKEWGCQVALTLYFYQYSDLELSLCFKRESIPKLDMDVVRSELASYPGMQSLFNAAAQQLGTLNLISGEHAGRTVNFGLRLELEGFQVCGEPVLGVDFRGKARIIAREVMASGVFAYGQPGHEALEREAKVQRFSTGETSVVHHSSKISVFLDLSQLEMPAYCQFRFFRLTGQDQTDHHTVELFGLDKLWVQKGRMKIKICST